MEQLLDIRAPGVARMSRLGRMVAAFSFVVVLLCGVAAGAFAGTTGALSGSVADSASRAPIAGASVTAVSASGSATAVSDKHGSFAFLSLAADTYTLSVSLAGFDTATMSGVTVQADQTVTYSVALARTLERIGSVRSRANASLIQPGISTDVYTVSAAQQRVAADKTQALAHRGPERRLDQARRLPHRYASKDRGRDQQ